MHYLNYPGSDADLLAHIKKSLFFDSLVQEGPGPTVTSLMKTSSLPLSFYLVQHFWKSLNSWAASSGILSSVETVRLLGQCFSRSHSARNTKAFSSCLPTQVQKGKTSTDELFFFSLVFWTFSYFKSGIFK